MAGAGSDGTPATPLIVVVTGAAGNIGRKLRAHLTDRGGYELRLIDRDPAGDSAILQADLAVYDERWASCFEGADILVHLAVGPGWRKPWNGEMIANVDATLNVCLAAARHRLRRVVFASSIWAVAARRRDRGPIRAGLPDPGPNAYGATKLFGERIGKALADAFGISTVAVRIGACARDDTAPPLRGLWDDASWISARDVCRGLECAMRADVAGLAVVNLTSGHSPGRWSLEEARALIGYEPLDNFSTTRRARLRAAVGARLRRLGILPSGSA